MTVLRNWSGPDKMPVEQDRKRKDKLVKPDALWDIHENLMNLEHQPVPTNYQYYPPPDHHPHSPGFGVPPHHEIYENDSYNNNNNVSKFNSSVVGPPTRRYSTGARVGTHRVIPNGHPDTEGHTGSRYNNDPGSIGSHPPHKYHPAPYRQYSSPDIGHFSQDESMGSSRSDYWRPPTYHNHTTAMELASDNGVVATEHTSSSANSCSLPDGYATLGSRKRGGSRSTTNEPDFSSRKSSDSGLPNLYRSHGNGLHLLNGPEFLAHSLALSSSGDNGSVSTKSRNGSSGKKSEIAVSSRNVISGDFASRQTSPMLNNTTSALSQREIQVQHARDAYLQQSSPLSQTQPIPTPVLVSQSAPSTPLSESFPGFVRQQSSNSGSSTPTSSIGGDVPARKQSANKSPLHTISENFFTLKSRVKNPKLGRSNSTPNILEDLENDDDIDQDDYGFLSYRSFRSKSHPFKEKPSSSSSTSAMNKSQEEQVQTRTFSKKWKKSKLTQTKSNPTSSWKPQGHCTWSSVGGKRLVLTPSHLLQLTEYERIILQKLANSKLQNMGLGCPIVIPKDSRSKRSKSRMFSIKKRTSSSGLLDNLKDKNKDSKDSTSGSCVFGMTLTKVLTSDRENGHRCPCPLRDHKDAPDFTRSERKWSTSSGCGLSTDSLSESDSRSTGSTLLDALSLSSVGGKMVDASWKEIDQRLQPHTPHIPYIMHCCLKHLENHGLSVQGIFRVGASKKRVKQLREEFDTGQEVELDEEVTPHDVGGLLKEFLRALADPLLTRDLYLPFLGTRKIKDDHKRLHTLRLLVALLPTSHRDALFALLRFLHLVSQHSTHSTDDQGQQIPGNKMNTKNLALLFAPNILNKSKAGEFQVDSPERAEQHNDITSVMKEMIDSYVDIFELPNDVQDEIYRSILESDPEALDILLRRKCHTQGVELELEISSLNDENDSLSASMNSDSLRPRTQSDVSSLPVDMSSSAENRPRPRTFNEAVVMQQILQQNKRHPNARTSSSGGETTTQKVNPHKDVQWTTDNVLHLDSKRQHLSDSQNWDPVIAVATAPAGHILGNHSKNHPDQARNQLRRERVSTGSAESQSKPSTKQLHRLSTPMEPSWSRDISRASPKPTDKFLQQNVHIKVIPELPAERPTLLSSMKSMLSPRPARRREDQGLTHSSSGNHLSVPSFSQRTGSKDKHASNSSLSSGYFGGSSRSGTTSPVTPDAPHPTKQWYLDTPPATPPLQGVPDNTSNSMFDFSKQEPGISQFHRTSSLHRPLGVAQLQSPTTNHGPQNQPHSPRLPQWQEQRWRHWEEVAKQCSDELKQQETLV